MTAAVYVVGGPTDDDRDDLRHSIRSLANLPSVDEVWVIGDVPAWFTGTRMPLEPLPAKFANQRQSLTRFVNYPSSPSEFVLMNDDMFITEPIDGSPPIIRNKADSSTWGNDHHGPHGADCWTCAVKATAAWTSDRLGRDVWLYENHTPLLFDTARLREAINSYPDQPLTVGELYPIAGCGGDGHVAGNAKVKAADSLDDKRALPMPYLSGNPDSWNGPLGVLIRAMFPTPSRYETTPPAAAPPATPTAA